MALSSEADLNALRESGRVVAEVLAAIRQEAAPGVRLSRLDELAREIIARAGAEPALPRYDPAFAPGTFPGAVTTSVNDTIAFGPPGPQELWEGDVLSVDCGVVLAGRTATAAASLIVGAPTVAGQKLLEVTRTALEEGVAMGTPGAGIGDISQAIADTGRSAGYGIPRLAGHDIGRVLGQTPLVPNQEVRTRSPVLEPGLVIAIEPIFVAGGGDSFLTTDDDWPVRTADGSVAAHFGHTVAITEDGPRVLTAP